MDSETRMMIFVVGIALVLIIFGYLADKHLDGRISKLEQSIEMQAEAQ